MSTFDTSRDQLVVQKGLEDRSIRYFPYENVLKVEPSRLQYAKNMARINFKSMAQQNNLRLMKLGGVTRKELIQVKSQFETAYIL